MPMNYDAFIFDFARDGSGEASNEAGETGKSSSHCVAQGPQLIARQASIATPVTPAGPSHFASS